MLWLALGALAQPVNEEIVVVGDPFDRWRGTRWELDVENWFPVEVTLAADKRGEFLTRGLRLHAVLACDPDGPKAESRRAMHVRCVVEDIAVRAAVAEKSVKPARAELLGAVVDELDAKLTGASLTLRTTRRGMLASYDLKGVTESNRKESLMAETLRLAWSRLLAGFEIEPPIHGAWSGEWHTNRSDLLLLPTRMTTNSVATLGHVASEVDGNIVVQSIGESTTTVLVELTEQEKRDPNNVHELGDAVGEQAAESANARAGDVFYKLNLRSVAVIAADKGWMTERVWSIHGAPTPGSPHADAAKPVFGEGSIRFLGTAEAPAVGASGVFAPPGLENGLPVWVVGG